MSDMDAADPEAGQGHPQDGPPEAPRQDSTESPDQEDDASEADADETGGVVTSVTGLGERLKL